MFTDETNKEPTKDVKFFIYGGLLFPKDQLFKLHEEIEQIRNTAGFSSTDEFKFNTHSKPTRVSNENFKKAKDAVLELCSDLGCKFIVHVILHKIIENQNQDRQIEWAADYVIGRYNEYLNGIQDIGLCVVDNLPNKSQWRYLAYKFTKGLKIIGQKDVPLGQIKLFAASCINASHAISAVDIVLGSFRYAINNSSNDQAAQHLIKRVFPLIWYEKINGQVEVIGKGLILRPEISKVSNKYKPEYDILVNHIRKMLS